MGVLYFYLDYFFLEVICCMLQICFSYWFFLLCNYITFNLYSYVLRKALTHVYHPLDLFNSLLITNRFSWIYGIGLRQSQVFLVAKLNLWICVRKTRSCHSFWSDVKIHETYVWGVKCILLHFLPCFLNLLYLANVSLSCTMIIIKVLSQVVAHYEYS